MIHIMKSHLVFTGHWNNKKEVKGFFSCQFYMYYEVGKFIALPLIVPIQLNIYV